MIGVEIKPVFHADSEGNILSPSGNVIVSKDQLVAPGVFYANVDLLNTVYHYGMQAAVTGDLVGRANERSRAEATREWLESDEPHVVKIAKVAASLPIDEEADRKANAAMRRLHEKQGPPRKLVTELSIEERAAQAVPQVVTILRVMHIIDQTGQPYGSERRCCNACGLMYTDDKRAMWVDSWDTFNASAFNCLKQTNPDVGPIDDKEGK